MRVAFLCALALLCASARADAADLTVVVKTPAGQPVKDAVIMMRPTSGGAPTAPIRFAWPMTMSQHNIQFDPFVLIVPVGSDVTFPNLDKVRHHVYSFSPAKRFELKLYGQEQARTVNFDKVGAVALGCNIHDSMVAFVKVVDTPYAAKTGPNGEATVRGVPAGAGVLTVWHPYLKAPNNETITRITVGAGAMRQAVTADLRSTGR